MTTPVILIANEALDRIAADAKRYAGRKERGGILLGFRRGAHIHVTEATLPMRWDWGTMFSFRRSSRGHQEAALHRWRETQHTSDWVGEWHSHPEALPKPSLIDLNSWRQMTESRSVPMVFLIIGYDALWVGLSVPTRALPYTYAETERSSAGVAFQRCSA